MLTPSSDATTTTDAGLPAGDPGVAPAALSSVAPPPVRPLWQPGVMRQMPKDQADKWVSRVDRGEARLKAYHPQWERALNRYAEAKVDKAKTDINALLDYRHVESKKSSLFHRTPDATLIPIDPADPELPVTQVLPFRQKFLNHELGPNGANLKRAIHKTLIDTLAASGWMIVKLGYEAVSLPDPQTQQQIPVWSRRYISQVSSKKLVLPDDFFDTDYDASPWSAVKGLTPVVQAKRLGWQFPPDFEGTTTSDNTVYKHDQTQAQSEAQVEYTEVWYRAAYFDDDVFNPDAYRCLILVKGVDLPVWWSDSPFQMLTDTGQLTDDSMKGSPIHIGTLRDLLDSAVVPSDLVVGEQLSVEVNKFRTDLTRNRTSRRDLVIVAEGLGAAKVEEIAKNIGPITVPDAYIDGAGNQRAVAIAQKGSEPRDNYTAQDYAQRDYESALGIGDNQGGNFAKTKRTATEVRTVQGNSSARAETEQDRMRDYTIALIRKYDTILQRTATQDELTKVLGRQGAAVFEQWAKFPGVYGYDILPDSGRYVDAQQYQQTTLDAYNLLRKDDRVNPDDLLEGVARALHRDPSKFIAPAQDKTMEAPKVTVSINLIDLNDPVAGRMALDLFANEGVKISPDTIQLMKAAHVSAVVHGTAGQPVGADSDPHSHGGSADRTEPINQHSTQKTGGLQGVGVQ